MERRRLAGISLLPTNQRLGFRRALISPLFLRVSVVNSNFG
jgi:hypothetical protein